MAVVRAQDHHMMALVLCGEICLLQAAKLVRGRAKLVEVYRNADPADRAAFGKTVGVDRVWDEAIAPSL